MTASSQSPGPAVSCPRGQGFPLPAAGRRRRAADPAGIPEPASACGRPSEAGGEGRAGEFPPARPPARPANAATASGPGASAGPAARRPTRSRRSGEGRPGTGSRAPGRDERRDRQTKGRGGGCPRCPSAPLPLPLPPPPALLVVAEDLVGDFTVENFLVRSQVPWRLLPDERLSVEQRHLPAARVRPASLEQIGGKGKPVRWGAPG